ncbi:RHS repeat-associated core domain-containing protein [Pseudomonas asiatica]|uniref:RHS repeat-associated core domain-containing protein n=1 Tax=Pseudomonas asiatica TaxID=2219225 RepID=UPI0034577295
MAQNRKQRLFYKNGQLSLEIGSDRSVTVFSISNLSLAQRSTETLLLAADAQSSIINRSHREGTHNLAYTAYGYSPTAHMMGFTGQRYDSVTNCYLLGNGYRAFSTRLARFYSADSLSPFKKHTHNAYAYCLGDPVNHHDPSGHMLRRARKAWNNVKNKVVKKPRIHYINKAREAITENPNLEKYSAVIDDENVTIKTLKAIYKLPKGDAMFSDLKDTAVRNWRLKHGNIEGPITHDFNYEKYLYMDEQLNYIALEAKILEYRTLLSNLASHEPTTMNSSSQLSPASPEVSGPTTARSAIRGT